MSPIRFLSPRPGGAPARRPVRPWPAGPLRSVGLLDNSKDRVELLIAGVAAALRERHPAVETPSWEKAHHSQRAPAAQLGECAARCQAAVLALAA